MAKLLSHSEIDFQKYDECVKSSLQGTVYAMSWYLDAVFPSWSAYVVGDYDVVMPIPLKRKFGLKYALQPQFCQQLGVFSKQKLNGAEFREMIKELPFLYCMNFNHGNLGMMHAKQERPNFVLGLFASYDTLSCGFSQQCHRSIRKASEKKQSVVAITKDEYLPFLQENGSRWINAAQLDILSRLIDNAFSAGCAELLSVRDEGEILAAVFFVNWQNRKYYLSPVSSEKGKQWQSMSFLLNKVIEDNSSSSVVLDFEGSAIAGVQNFYRGFGAVNEPYPIVEKNGWIRKLMRK